MDPTECPITACMELQEAWKLGKGAFDARSKWCQKCGEEEPKTAKICKERTQTADSVRREKKKTTRNSNPRRVGTKEERTEYGHGLNKQSGIIDVHFLKGSTSTEIKAAGGGNLNRVKSHIAHLKTAHRTTVTFSNGVYKILK